MATRNQTPTSPLAIRSGLLATLVCAVALVYSKRQQQAEAFSPPEDYAVIVFGNNDNGSSREDGEDDHAAESDDGKKRDTIPQRQKPPTHPVAVHYLSSRGFTVFSIVWKDGNNNDKTARTKPPKASEDAKKSIKKNKMDQTAAAAAASRIIPLSVSNDGNDSKAALVENVKTILQQRHQRLVAVINHATTTATTATVNNRKASDNDNDDDDDDNTPKARRLLETNVVRVIGVTEAFVPLLLQQQQQRKEDKDNDNNISNARIRQPSSSSPSTPLIINVAPCLGSTITSRQRGSGSSMEHAYYETSLAALHGLTEAWRRTFLKGDDIRVSLLLTGGDGNHPNTATTLAEREIAVAICEILQQPAPRARYHVGTVRGLPTQWWCWTGEVLPMWMTDPLLYSKSEE